MSQRDSIVVGAGPAGSCAAFALARAGWNVLLLEAERSPGHKVCGEFLSPESRLSLKRLGLLEVVTACSPASVRRAQLTSRWGQTVRLRLPAVGWGLSRRRLDRALADAASSAGARVEYGARALDFEANASGGYSVRLRTRQGSRETVRASTLLWAAGRGSHTSSSARSLSVSRGRSRGESAARGVAGATHRAPPRAHGIGVKCHFAGADMPPQVELHFFKGGYVGVNPIEDGLCNVCVMASHARFTGAQRSPLRLLEMAIESSRGLRTRLRSARIAEGTLRARFPVGPTRRATPWERAPRLGDAVASIAPLCGDGIAMALRSAELCASGADSYLHGMTSLRTWEAEYRRVWRVECEKRCRTGRLLQSVLTTPLLSELLVSSARVVPALARYFVDATRGAVHPADISGTG